LEQGLLDFAGSTHATDALSELGVAPKEAAAAKALSIAVHDHLVIGRGGHASFKSLGLL
jgi:DNA repair protein RadC